ncbi:hypothetical protein [Microbacterium stercoris]|uniref:PrsW family intramembrane metalloprotease n=1 Tax=Microbacterium stercoris TaxID=2820289 RepID=A0A939TS16_9MICO|nr:hypothetical protein [Microbacterium stercoris]MBO3665085.1 hypothetical protein [Microbacterium stercoris]
MTCPRCAAGNPAAAHFCQACGLDLHSGDASRRCSYAVKPDEPVASFALVSTIMPRGAAQHPQTYRIALGIGLFVALIAAVFGALPIALLVAAFTVPLVYIVYLYDVNLWDDQPVQVTLAAFGLTAVLGAAFTWGWTQFVPATSLVRGPDLATLLIVGVAVPIVAHLLIQLGPVYLASRPRFDDLMDGLTFGIVSGVAYSAGDTLVRHGDALLGGFDPGADPATWVALVFLEGLVKPLIFGTAAGIAAAEFSGLGRGYDGFTGRYARGLAEAIVATIVYQTGAYLLSFLPVFQGVALTVVLGLAVLAVLILRVRTVLHKALLEGALEAAARDDQRVGATGELAYCTSCEMPLLAGASFCSVCGTAQRTRPRVAGAFAAAQPAPAPRADEPVPIHPGPDGPPSPAANNPAAGNPAPNDNEGVQS